jgi:NitT/TauT family transport system substrate-binding protein
LLSGCSLLNGPDSASSSTANPDHLERPAITVGVIPIVNCAAFYLALEHGFFKQQGLTVIPKATTSGTASIPLLSAGGLDVTVTNDVTAIEAQAKHTADLKFIVDGYQSAPGDHVVTALPNAGVTTVQDLVGKTVAVNTLSDVVTLGFQAVLEASGIRPSAIHFVVIPYANMEEALKTHQVAAATEEEPYLTQSERDLGVASVMDVFGADGPTANIPISAYVTTAAFARANPKTVAAFQRAMQQGAQLAGSRVNVEQVLPTYTKIDRQIAALIHLGVYPTTLNPTRLQRVADLMQTFGMLTGPFNVRPLVLPMPAS